MYNKRNIGEIFMHLMTIAMVATVFSISAAPVNLKADNVDSSRKTILLLTNSELYSDRTNYEHEAINAQDGNLDIVCEHYCHECQVDNPDYEDEFTAYLTKKETFYGGFDGIITTSDTILSYVMNNVDESDLFYEVPIMFMNVNNEDFAKECSLNKWVTGVTRHVDLNAVVKQALKFSPNAVNVNYIYDDTWVGKYYKSQLLEAIAPYNFENTNPLNISKYSMTEIRSKIADFDKNDICIYLNASLDGEGNTYTISEFSAEIQDSVNCIMMTTRQENIGSIAIGGYFIDEEEIYTTLFDTYESYFASGENFWDISIDADFEWRYIFDQDIISKYRIYESYLPENSIILNEDISFQEEYPVIFYALSSGVIAFLFVTIILVGLNFDQREKIKKVDKMDEELEQKLRIGRFNGLLNKYAFNQDIEKYMAKGETFGVGLLNIDNYSKFTNYYGQTKSSSLIKVLANHLMESLSKKITVYVFSRKEIALLLPAKDKQELTKIIDLFNEQNRVVYKIDNTELHITWTTGFTLFPVDGRTSNELITNAFFAMEYGNKYCPANAVLFDEEKINPIKRMSEEKEMLRYSLENGLIDNYYSPIIDISTGDISILEARTNIKGVKYSKNESVELYSATHMVSDLAKRTINLFCDFISEVQNKKELNIPCSFDASIALLKEKGAEEYLVSVFKEKKISFSSLIFNVDEALVKETGAFMNRFLEFVKENNIGLCLKNFGNSYSSIRAIYEMPLTMVKMSDKITNRFYDNYMVEEIKSFINYLHSQGMKICFTNITDARKAKFFIDAGADFEEGTYFSEVLSPEEMLEKLGVNYSELVKGYIEKKEAK